VDADVIALNVGNWLMVLPVIIILF
jgi:hypothetical protein